MPTSSPPTARRPCGGDFRARRPRRRRLRDSSSAVTSCSASIPQRASRRASYDLGGAWKLEGVSANGRWVGLTRAGNGDPRPRHRDRDDRPDELELSGDFVVETISVDGDFLFLQQNFVDGTYAVRGYDVARNQMVPGSLGRKGQTLKMQGRPDRSSLRRTASGC